MSEGKFVELVERVFERLENRPKSLGQHVREWAPIAILAASMLVGYGRLMQRQDTADTAIIELRRTKVDKENLKISLDAQNDRLTMIYNELVEIRKLSYPPSFTAFAPGTKVRARKY